MASFFTDNEDLLYYVDQGIDWAALAEVSEYGWRAKDGFANADEARQFYRDVAVSFGELVAEQIAPRAAAVDREDTHLKEGEAVEGPAMRAIFAALKSADMHRLC